MWYLPDDYVWVHTRVENFHKEHEKNMSINTEFKLDWEIAIFKAVVITKKWTFSWSSFWKLWKEKAFEKLETVAVWRALAFAWYEVKSWIASNEEMQVFNQNEQETITKPPVSYWWSIAPKANNNDLWKCSKCGADNRLSQAWKAYCSKLCWKN